MNLSTMQSLVTQRLNEGTTPTFYPTSEITAALNEANRFFCLLTLGLEVTASWPVPAYNSSAPFYRMLTVFSDWIVPLRITDGAGKKIRPALLDDLTALDPGWWNIPGTPTRYVALGADFLGLYPQSAAGATLQVTYARCPVALANNTDTPEIPAEYHPRLVDYAIYRMRQVEGGQEFAKGMEYFNAFLDGAQHYAAYVRSRNLGSRYDRVPFELESFDRSTLLKLRKDLVE